MQKNTTPLFNSTLKNQLKKVKSASIIEPKQDTLNLIMQFASSYKVEKVDNNHFVELYLN